MEFNGATPPPPPPTRPPSASPSPQGQHLPPLPPGTGAARGVQLRISRRLLWVGQAAYPLHNIVRVQTVVLTPDRVRALIRFLRWAAVLTAAYFLLAWYAEDNTDYLYGDYGYEESTDSTVEALWGVGALAGMFLVGLLVHRLSRPDLHVMAVEVASGSLALVSLPDESQLDVVVQHVVHAIDHPEAEISIRMDRVEVNLKNYHFGDSVNINGGVGNSGVVRT